MSEVDNEARLNASKALTVIFIILITLASIGLLIKLVTKLTQGTPVRLLMVISLALGTLLYALFTLVVSAKLLFRSDSSTYMDVSCRTILTASIYGNYFLPFVYAVSLLCLIVEAYQYSLRASTPSVIAKLIYISVPWLAALVIVLPLTMSGIDWVLCNLPFTLGRFRAQIYVCVLIPVLSTAIISVVFSLKTKNQTPPVTTATNVPPSNYNPNAFNPSHGVVLSVSPQYHTDQHQQQTQHHLQPQQYREQQHAFGADPPSYSTCEPQDTKSQSYPQPPQSYSHSTPPPTLSAQVPQNNYYPPPPNYAPPPPGFGAPLYGHNHQPLDTVQLQPNAPVATVGYRNVKDEAGSLVLVSIFFCILSLPYCIFTLGYQLNSDAEPMDPLPFAIIFDSISWVCVLRWFVVTLIWLKVIK